MADTERIRSVAAELFAKGDDASIDRAAQLIKTASEAENQAAQAAKYAAEELKLKDDLSDSKARRWSEERRAYITSLTPVIATLLSTAALFTTLVLQFSQYRLQSRQAEATMTLQNQAAKDQRESNASTLQLQRDAAEDVRWKDAQSILLQDKELSPTRALLTTFSKSPRYRPEAYDIARKLLLKSKSPVEFLSTFTDVFYPVTWDNLRPILNVDQELYRPESPLAGKVFTGGNYRVPKTAREKAENDEYLRLYSEIEIISAQIAPLLKKPRPAEFSADLSDTGIWNCDLKGVDLSGWDLSRMLISRTNLDGANLSGVTRFEGLDVYSTAWWKARSISGDLFRYLVDRPGSAYDPDPNALYGNLSVRISQAEYDDDLKKLKRASGIP